MSKYETPKRFTAINDVTGALIKSKATLTTEYANGWDAVWGKKEVAPEISDNVQLYLSLSSNLFERLTTQAEDDKITLNTFITNAIVHYLAGS